MKRTPLPFIGVIAAIVAMAAARPSSVARWTEVPSVRNESAGGTVSLLARGGGDDDELKQIARARLRNGEAGTYISEILLERDSSLARWHDRPMVPVTVWVQSAPQIEDWNDDYINSVSD